MNAITLEIPLQSALNTTVRLTTGGVCAFAGLSFDDSEDCKVCVTESLILLAKSGYRRARITFTGESGLEAVIEGRELGEKGAEAAEDEISAALIAALAENVVMEKSGGAISEIRFQFGLKA